MKIQATICARNELIYLQHLLPYLAGEAIDVVLIDNESSDGTLEAVASGIFQNVVHVEHLPYKGFFDLSQQLQVKEKLSSICDADWVIHQDADEFLTSPSGWGGLRENIEQADAMGFNVVNFNELVMLPDNPEIDDFSTNNRLFYFFEPRPLRLMRSLEKECRPIKQSLRWSYSGG
ncbi:MAG: glycosyltransferase family 2 protein [Erythrobacter sp.]